MDEIIAKAHELGEKIAASDAMRRLVAAKDAYDADTDLGALLREYETDRQLLGEQFSKEEQDAAVVTSLREKLEELTGKIFANKHYTDFTSAQKDVNDIMAKVNAEIKFCITGERPSECTHDCSTCGGCSH